MFSTPLSTDFHHITTCYRPCQHGPVQKVRKSKNPGLKQREKLSKPALSVFMIKVLAWQRLTSCSFKILGQIKRNSAKTHLQNRRKALESPDIRSRVCNFRDKQSSIVVRTCSNMFEHASNFRTVRTREISIKFY